MNHLKDMSRKLPEFTIGGTVFTVDGRIYEFRKKEAPRNKIPMEKFSEETSTIIFFDKKLKNIHHGRKNGDERPAHVEKVLVPPIVELDPVGLARRYNLRDDVFKKTIVVNLNTPYREVLEQNTRNSKKGRGIK